MRAWLANLLLTLALAIAIVATLWTLNRAAAPEAFPIPTADATSANVEAILAAITPATVHADLAAMQQLGSRFTASPGHEAAADWIAEQLQTDGYQVIRQPVRVVVPVTRFAVLRDDAGEVIADVLLNPIEPNWFRTATTPLEGIRGRVFHAEHGAADAFGDVDLRGAIVLLPAGQPRVWAPAQCFTTATRRSLSAARGSITFVPRWMYRGSMWKGTLPHWWAES